MSSQSKNFYFQIHVSFFLMLITNKNKKMVVNDNVGQQWRAPMYVPSLLNIRVKFVNTYIKLDVLLIAKY